MNTFQNRIQLNSSQRSEVLKYLKSYTVNGEFSILQLVRRMKQMEEDIRNIKMTLQMKNERKQ